LRGDKIKAPAEAQKNLLRTLIKEIVVHEDSIELKMYIGPPPEETLSSFPGAMRKAPLEDENSPENKKRPAENCEALNRKTQGLPECLMWLPLLETLRTFKGDISIENIKLIS